MKREGNILMVSLVGVAIVSLALAGYFFYQNKQLQKSKLETIIPTPTSVAKDETENWNSITVTDKNLTFKIPKGFGFRSGLDDSFRLIDSNRKITGNLFLFSSDNLTKERYQL